ncbi:MAG: hypothetical protein A2487_09955 [Candidatus Raymondbacteria bacterium RifOxyC12_full_50_8]|nr:MAG: hypothetical protein A2248_13810 [Candidatus Raymondbacteria bacterium RIFOXYA2_FULL_49_16]OGK03924.1 MAG: hypothetical protein A2350_15000 [Candidatus Raymondbacteria bacterium RifOxyB12_full_50_8]OGK06122.1 MAG: hypothetical protein A2487_09955 [Candidatus Raymondbacteria bacterium RifOxyC12_full_50_8]OGP43920.1 MAG: hypothetical protein A2324_00415 [Candidatus Raymondbacteria bacterium RIFOXYB2_FULL_49_35]
MRRSFWAFIRTLDRSSSAAALAAVLFIGLYPPLPEASMAVKKGPDSTQWYEQPMRIAALQCNFEKDNPAVIDMWAADGFNVEQLFHPTADLYSALFDPAAHRTIVEQYVKKAHAKGVRIILYLNIHILGPSLESKKDIWAQRTAAGEIVKLYTTYPAICLNSPWKDYFFSILDTLSSLDIDGIFLDGPVIGSEGCQCKYCEQAHQKLYGKPLKDTPHHWEFCHWTKDNFLQAAYARWKEKNPGKIFYMNLPVFHAASAFVDIPAALQYNDILGTEGGFMPYGPAKNAFLWKPSFTAKMIEAISPDKPRVIFMAADHKPWSWWMHSPLETKLCIASCNANAANVWYGLHGSTILLRTPSGAAAGQSMRFFRDNERYFSTTRSLARVALFYSFTSDRYYPTSRGETDFSAGGEAASHYGDLGKSLHGYYSMLAEMQVPFDLVTDLAPAADALGRYDLIVLPSCGALTTETVTALEAYVRSGGTLIADFDASLFDSLGARKPDFALSKVFGVSVDGEYQEHRNWNYFSVDSSSGCYEYVKVPLLPLPLASLPVKVLPQARVIARSLPDLPGRYVALPAPQAPFLTRNSFGKGACFYFAGNFGQMYNDYRPPEYRALLRGIVREQVKDLIAFDNAPGNLEVVLRKQGPRALLHLVNYGAGADRPFDRLLPVDNMIIRLPSSLRPAHARSCALKRDLVVSKKTNSIVLPRLAEYDLIVME